jgi:hypothetical protein
MKYISVTEIDSITKIPCTVEPQRTGPSMPEIKGWEFEWANKSTFPVKLAPDGTYLRAPLYYGTCDDDANLDVPGFLEVLSEEEYNTRKIAEFEARKPHPSWVWDNNTLSWVAPIPRPNDAIINGGTVAYKWDEKTVSWIPR